MRAVFVRSTRGLLEFSLAVLCLWAAYWHTPVGALLRGGVAWILGVRSSARPLLAYYSGGAFTRGGVGPWGTRLPLPPLGASITPTLALGYAIHASLKQIPAAERGPANDLASLHGIPARALVDVREGPAACGRLMTRAAMSLSSQEGAVLSLFAGPEPARYAVERARAEGIRDPRLNDLARHLPPGFGDAIAASHDALALAVAYGLGWPVSERIAVSSGFGVRDHPILGIDKLHTGIDLPLPIGTPVRSVADGIVRRASEDAVNGRVLVLEHGYGVTTAYCHNAKLLVREGQEIARGAVIALSGNTGRSTGPHLHYQLELSDRPVDPLAFRPGLPASIAGGRVR
jgi:murein DD-endopeptidase